MGKDVIAPVWKDGSIATGTQNDGKYTAKIKWPKATDNVKVTKYQVRIYDENGKKVGTTISTSSTSCTTDGIAAGNYTITVKALDDARNSSEEIKGTLTIKDITAPKTGSFKVTQLANSYTLKFTVTDFKDIFGPDERRNTGDIDHYIVSYQFNNKWYVMDSNVSGKIVTWEDSKHAGPNDVGNTRKFKIVAVDAAGNKSKEVTASVKIHDGTAPVWKNATTSSFTQNSGKYTGTLQWTKATDNVSVKSYEVSIFDQNGKQVGKTVSTSKNSCTTPELAAGTYTFTVKALDAEKNYATWRGDKTITIADVTAPTAGNLKVTQYADSYNLKLRITGFKDITGPDKSKNTAKVDHYVISAYKDGKWITVNKYLAGDATSWDYNGVITKADVGSTRKFRVMAVDAAGNKSKQVESSVKIVDETDPVWSANTKLTYKQSSGKYKATLEWTKATDNVKVTEYQVKLYNYEKGNKVGSTISTSKNTCTTAELAPGAYKVTIKALDANKNSAIYDQGLIVITDYDAPTAGKITLTKTGNEVSVKASGFKDNSGTIASYTLFVDGKQVEQNDTGKFVYNLTDSDPLKVKFGIVAADASGRTCKVEKTLETTLLPVRTEYTVSGNYRDVDFVRQTNNVIAQPTELRDGQKCSINFGMMNFGLGDDKLTIGGCDFYARKIDFFKDNNNLLVSDFGQANVKIETLVFGDGKDNVDVKQSSLFYAGMVNMGNGDNTFYTERNGVNIGQIVFGSGADTYKFKLLDRGEQYKVNKCDMGSGKDKFILEGLTKLDDSGSSSAGSAPGASSVAKPSSIEIGELNMGSGSDTVSFNIGNNAVGAIIHNVDMGSGSDTFTLGANSTLRVDSLIFGDGTDTLNIGENSCLNVHNLDVKNLEKLNIAGGTAVLQISDWNTYTDCRDKFGSVANQIRHAGN